MARRSHYRKCHYKRWPYNFSFAEKFKIGLRRHLSVFRDNCLSKHPRIVKMMKNLKTIKKKMKIVVIGSKGMLAQDLIPRLRNTGIKVIGLDFPELDINQLGDTRNRIDVENPFCECHGFAPVSLAAG